MGEVIGNYEIVAELKRGGMGIVYTARHRSMGQMAVVKKLLPEHTGSTDVVQRFFQEAQAAAALDDPGIVRIFDQGVLADGSAYIVMELLQGESLADRLRRVGRLVPSVAVTFVRQAARAVSKAHARGIVHRDLKPDNLFIVPDPDIAGGERIKVLDFGIAKLAGDARVKTMTAMPMGTPAYMSPEQWASAGRVDARTDVYAFGIILFEMLVGRLPFEGPGMIEFIDQHRFTPVPPISSFDPALASFDPIIARCLAKAPDDRFASLDELARALPAGTGVMSAAPAAAVGMAATLPAGAMAMGTPAGAMAMGTPAHAPTPTTLGSAAGAMAASTEPPSRRRSPLPMVLALAGIVAVTAFAVVLLARDNDEDEIDAGVIATAPSVSSGSAASTGSADPPTPAPAAVDTDAAQAEEAPIDAAVAVGSNDRPRRPSTPPRDPPPEPKPVESPRRPPPTTGPLSCDEVECVINNYEGKCCERFRKQAPKPAPGLPEHLDKAMIVEGVNRVRGRVQACIDKSPSAKGTVQLVVKVSPEGTVSSASVASSPDPGLGTCAASAMKTARFAKTQNGGSFKYPFVFR